MTNKGLAKRIGTALLCWGIAWITATNSRAQQRATTRAGTTGTGIRDYQNSTLVGDAIISSDPETRRLIVITDEDTNLHISQVISNLDRPKPQVLIKVVFMEVSYSKGSDIGIEGSYTKNFGGGNSYTGIVNQVFGNGLISQAPNLAPPGAGIYTILGSDFQATLRAIAQAGKTEILSRPSILARNNQQATISLGQQVPLVTNTRFDTLGNQINTVTYQNVGIILQVTPFITSDGMVEMIVAPQTSELADRSQWVPISSGSGTQISAPVINLRQADTVVVVPDGQTVVIGGLMEKQRQQSDSKIPFLGDIPLLGNLFKRRIKDDSKTELLIFLTPHVVPNPGELAKVTSSETGKSEFAPRAFDSGDLEKFLDGLPMKPSAPQPK